MRLSPLRFGAVESLVARISDGVGDVDPDFAQSPFGGPMSEGPPHACLIPRSDFFQFLHPFRIPSMAF